MMKNGIATGIFAMTIGLGPAAASATPYALTIFNGLGGTSNTALAINNSGHVVGTSNTSGNATTHAVSWKQGALTDLGVAYGQASYAYDINSQGQIAGYSFGAALGSGGGPVFKGVATLWAGGNTVALSNEGFAGAFGYGINESGVVVGTVSNAGSTSAAKWVGDSFVLLGSLGGASGAAAINSAGDTVGWSYSEGATSFSATYWSGSTASALQRLSGTTGASSAESINDSGTIVGYSALTPGGSGSIATVWFGGVAQALESLGGQTSAANSLNEVGDIVGYSESVDGIVQAALWSGGKITNLNDLLDDASLQAGWHLDTAQDINDYGWIVGTASNARLGIYSAAFLLARESHDVPEPSTALLMFGPLAILLFRHRRRSLAGRLHRERGSDELARVGL